MNIAAIVAAVLGFLGTGLKLALQMAQNARDKLLVTLGASQERNKATEAEADTQEALKEIADDRSAIPDAATNPDDLARELRGQKSGSGGSGRKRPF